MPFAIRNEKTGEIKIHHFPLLLDVSRELLEDAEPRYLWRDWRTVTICDKRVCHRYRITGRGPFPRSYRMIRIIDA